MLTRAPAMSNIERQRKFRLSHPGYFNKYNARRRGSKGERARMQAKWAAAARAAAEEQAAASTTAERAMPAAGPLSAAAVAPVLLWCSAIPTHRAVPVPMAA
jgi:hypothetical protein